jgi:hypothetical protein
MKRILCLGILIILFLPIISATKIAYILKDISNPNPQFIEVINELNYTYSLIDDSEVSSTNFSEYKMILLDDENIKDIPVNDYSSLIVNPSYHEEWSRWIGSTGSTHPLRANNSNYNIRITDGLHGEFQVYTKAKDNGISIPMYYLKKVEQGVNKVTEKITDSQEYVIATKENPRRVFFGITKSEFWTQDSRQLFKNSILWLIEGEDRDKDGFFTDDDCDDNNALINPGATEIPYDGIDQDCDGFDLIDVDGDGYCKEGYLIMNKNLQCPFETGTSGTDCDDSDASINPGSNDSLKNCINEAPIFSGPISEISWNEDDSTYLDLDQYFSDPDGDNLEFNISQTSEDENISVFFLWNGLVKFESEENWYGKDWVIFSANDGELETETNNISLIVNSINDAPILDLIGNKEINESELLEFSLNVTDVDGNVLTYQAANLPSGATFSGDKFSWTPNYSQSGIYYVTFNVTDGEFWDEETIKITVLNLNYAPILEDIANQTILEDTLGYVLVHATDENNDSLEYSILNENILEVNCEVENNNVTFTPAENWFGIASCEVEVNDNEGGKDSKIFYIEVQPVNDAPILNEIENIVIQENEIVNINAHATDAENDNLTYNINDTVRFTNNGDGNFTWQTDYDDEGNYQVEISVEDGNGGTDSKIVFIEVLNTNQLPTIFIENQTILEDSGIYYADIISNDSDGYITEYNVLSENIQKVNCEVNYTSSLLEFEPAKDFEGIAYCEIEAVDNSNGKSSINVKFEVQPVNDAPEITDFIPENPVRILEGDSKYFSVNVEDVDNSFSDIIIEWIINGISFIGKSYRFNKTKGNYNVSVNVSDGFLYDILNWNVVVGDISDFSCSEMNGYLCSENEICPENYLLGVYDTDKCCKIKCIPSPPDFRDLDICENLNSNIKIKIKEPDEGDEFEIGEIIQGKIKLENKFEEDKDFEIEIYLYDSTENEEIKSVEKDIGLDECEDGEIEFEIELLEDIKESSEYYIYVIVKDEDNRTLCNQKYEKIKIERTDSKIIIRNAEVIENVKAGNFLGLKIEVENLGKDDEEVYIVIKSEEIGVYEEEGPFEIEEYDKKNYLSKIFNIKIPEETEEGIYVFNVLVQGEESKDSENIEFEVYELGKYPLINDEIALENREISGFITLQEPTQKTIGEKEETIVLNSEEKSYLGDGKTINLENKQEDSERSFRIYLEEDSQSFEKKEIESSYWELELDNLLFLVCILLLIGIIIEIILIILSRR